MPSSRAYYIYKVWVSVPNAHTMPPVTGPSDKEKQRQKQYKHMPGRLCLLRAECTETGLMG